MTQEVTQEEKNQIAEAILKNKKQCGSCSESYILLELYPSWEEGFYVCEDCVMTKPEYGAEFLIRVE